MTSNGMRDVTIVVSDCSRYPCLAVQRLESELSALLAAIYSHLSISPSVSESKMLLLYWCSPLPLSVRVFAVTQVRMAPGGQAFIEFADQMQVSGSGVGLKIRHKSFHQGTGAFSGAFITSINLFRTKATPPRARFPRIVCYKVAKDRVTVLNTVKDSKVIMCRYSGDMQMKYVREYSYHCITSRALTRPPLALLSHFTGWHRA